MARRGENIRKRSDGRWEGRYIKGRSADGKPCWGYVYGATYTEVREISARKKAEYGIYNLNSTDITFSEISEQWLYSVRHGVKESTFSHYQYTLRHYLQPVFGDFKVSALSEKILEQGLLAVITPANGKQKPLGATMAQECLSMLRRICKYAAHFHLIAYGAYTDRSQCDEEKLNEWYTQFNVNRGDYYLIVGRFVPENNYETMITEFMRSKTEKDLVIITNVEHNKFYEQLREKTGFEKDKRIKFVGTVYDQDLLKKIREEAYGYLHGHEVGGTNPSLLEALASTRLNLLLGVGFNKEVGEDSALYWSKDSGNLAALLEQADALDADTIALLDKRSTDRVRDAYSWEKIVGEYEKTFLEG